MKNKEVYSFLVGFDCDIEVGFFEDLDDEDVDKKQKKEFLCFDVCKFYPSINEELLNKALDFGERYTTITKQERQN